MSWGDVQVPLQEGSSVLLRAAAGFPGAAVSCETGVLPVPVVVF